MLNEFKKFILKGNVVDLSTGVIIGAAFTGIVTAFTKGIVEPILALAGKGPNPELKIPIMEKLVEVTENDVTKEVMKQIELDLGIIIGAFISFLITAAVVFFVIVKPMNMLKARQASGAEPPPPTPEDIQLLREIRDELRRR